MAILHVKLYTRQALCIFCNKYPIPILSNKISFHEQRRNDVFDGCYNESF